MSISGKNLRLFATLMGLLSVASLVAFGLVGIGRQGPINFDGSVLYAAGRAWLNQADPYDHAALARAVADVPGMDVTQLGFFYPPQSAAICVLLGLFPYSIASRVWILVNLGALATVVRFILTVMQERRQPGPDGGKERARWSGWIVAAIAIGNPFTLHVIWMGQTSLLAVAAILGTWFYSGRRRWLAAGLCLGLASFKPQLCLLVVLWLILERHWRTLLAGGVTAAALASYAMLVQGGPLGALRAWHDGVTSGYGMMFNLPSFSHKVGVESLVYAIAGVSLPGLPIMLTGIALTVLAWFFRTHFDRVTILALLMIITVTFSVYLHDYDYVALIPAYLALWWCAMRGPALGAATALLLLSLFLPQRLVHLTGIAALDQWRSIVIGLMGLVILLAGRVGRDGHGPDHVMEKVEMQERRIA